MVQEFSFQFFRKFHLECLIIWVQGFNIAWVAAFLMTKNHSWPFIFQFKVDLQTACSGRKKTPTIKSGSARPWEGSAPWRATRCLLLSQEPFNEMKRSSKQQISEGLLVCQLVRICIIIIIVIYYNHQCHMKLGAHIGLRVDQVRLIIINPLNPPEPDLICLEPKLQNLKCKAWNACCNVLKESDLSISLGFTELVRGAKVSPSV